MKNVVEVLTSSLLREKFVEDRKSARDLRHDPMEAWNWGPATSKMTESKWRTWKNNDSVFSCQIIQVIFSDRMKSAISKSLWIAEFGKYFKYYLRIFATSKAKYFEFCRLWMTELNFERISCVLSVVSGVKCQAKRAG